MYVCAGFNGHGAPRAFQAGQAVADIAMGRSPEVFVDRFDPSSPSKGQVDNV